MRVLVRILCWSALALPVSVPVPAGAADAPGLPPAAGRQVDFEGDIEPILHQRCYACHGPSMQMNGLRFDRRDVALKGGYSGRAIIPGDSARSPLILRLASGRDDFRMPPSQPPLGGEQIGVLRAWIDQGAAWPERATQDRTGVPVAASAHWSFQPLRRPDPPAVNDSAWSRAPVDRFVLAKLESEGIDPSPEAERHTLLRRVSLDLTGLPPTPRETQAFLSDDRPDAYERLVDRLLESKHYGEKWARHWLDLARYADSDGYEKDLARPYAWRWRQWVIDALNADMPFDEFTTLQLAADLLEDPTPDQLAATGFHRNTLRNREGGTKRGQTRFEETLDRANTVSSVWLGLTVECAQCHDHKYDPITQKDFYSMYAFFDNVLDTSIDAPLPGELGPYLAKRSEYLAKRQALLEEHRVPELQPEWERQMKIAGANPGQRTDWDLCFDVLFQMTDGGWEVLNKEPSKRTFREQEMLTGYFVDWYYTVISDEKIKELGFKELKKKLKDLKDSYPQLSEARVIQERDRPGTTHLRLRGLWDSPGIEVQPRAPSFLPWDEGSGRPNRLDLARWILSEDNPLTARVAVNRMWQEFFGQGLVPTSEDFGTQGEPPSHPRLLDWLAAEFMDQGWRVKRMHKLIVTSATYRQSSKARPAVAERDPENFWLARQNRLRLPAETLRDAALSVSALLSRTVGGPSVFPPQPTGVADLTYGWDTERWQDSTGASRYRRGLYTFFQRTAPYPQMMNFDAPDSNRTASRRRRSNTPLQALNLLNDEVFVEAAQALAWRTLKDSRSDWRLRLERMFLFALARPPTETESRQLRGSYDRQLEIMEGSPPQARQLASLGFDGIEATEAAAWTGLARVLLNTDEFISRE